ncbi:hypothetical protein [Bordetella flabilis]|uniref:DUF4189 domain-containing protein n=1 Tax=Bordetella flabilis TaxID=463014 RepID=A0A193GNG4_9BORD|nr:hypothetical protein [Bordetella flabilis]ANN80909.1 hypothetical protein BAU07_26590 [Bordetella flabilis]
MNYKRLAIALMLGWLAASPASAAALSWESVVTFVNTLRGEASSWSVTTQQTAVSAQQQNDSRVRSESLLASAIGAIEMSERVGNAVVSVDPAVGQPSTLLCEAQTEGALRVEALGQRDRDATRLMQSFSSSRVSSQAKADAAIIAQRKNTYCTVSEARSGACDLVPNAMQGWDSNYAGAFSQSTLSPEGELAGYAYTAMLTDVRASAAVDCSSAACQGAAANQMRLAAMSSLAANSLVGQVTDRRVPVLTGQ